MEAAGLVNGGGTVVGGATTPPVEEEDCPAAVDEGLFEEITAVDGVAVELEAPPPLPLALPPLFS